MQPEGKLWARCPPGCPSSGPLCLVRGRPARGPEQDLAAEPCSSARQVEVVRGAQALVEEVRDLAAGGPWTGAVGKGPRQECGQGTVCQVEGTACAKA